MPDKNPLPVGSASAGSVGVAGALHYAGGGGPYLRPRCRAHIDSVVPFPIIDLRISCCEFGIAEILSDKDGVKRPGKDARAGFWKKRRVNGKTKLGLIGGKFLFKLPVKRLFFCKKLLIIRLFVFCRGEKRACFLSVGIKHFFLICQFDFEAD